MNRILFFGDSITDARRIREDSGNLGCGYASLVAASVGADNPGVYEFLNRGVSGDRSVDLYARIKIDCINLKPDYISIFAGINDVLHEAAYSNGINSKKTYHIFKMMIEEIKDALPDSKIILVEPYVFCGSDTEYKWSFIERETVKTAEAISKIADEFCLPLVRLRSVFEAAFARAPQEYYVKDGVHPTVVGHKLIANEWKKVFYKIIGEGTL